MRVITVRQPGAWAIIHGGQDVENWSRNIAGSYRGLVAIHAGLTYEKGTLAGKVLRDAHGSETPTGLAFGAIIGVAVLVGVHEGWSCTTTYPADGGAPTTRLLCDCSSWAMADRYHLVLANPCPLPEPIPCRGQSGLWTLDDALTSRVEIALESLSHSSIGGVSA